MYNFIINPENSQKTLLKSPMGKKILRKYLARRVNKFTGGAASMIGQKSFRPVTAINYFESEALANFKTSMETNMSEYLDTYIKIQIGKLAAVISVDMIKSFTDTSMQLLSDFMIQGFCIMVSKVIYVDDAKRKKYIEVLEGIQNTTQFQFVTSIQETSVTPVEARRIQTKRPMAMAYGGRSVKTIQYGGQTKYGSLKELLEIIAEPKHDFSGDRSGRCVGAITANKKTCEEGGGRWINTVRHHFIHNQCGDKGLFDGSLTGEESGIDTAIKDVEKAVGDSIGNKGSLKMHYKNAFPGVRECLNRNGGTMEPQLFSSLFMNKNIMLTPGIGPNPMHINKFHFYSVKTVSETMIRSVDSEGGEHTITLPIPFLDYLVMILQANDTTHTVFDTAAGIVGWSTIGRHLESSSITRLVPLVNMWDPAGTSVKEYRKSVADYGDGKMNNTYMAIPKPARGIVDWTPVRDNLSNSSSGSFAPGLTYKIEHNTTTAEPPILFTLTRNIPGAVPNSIKLLLQKGFPVSSLASVLEGILGPEPPCGNSSRQRNWSPKIVLPETTGGESHDEDLLVFVGALQELYGTDELKNDEPKDIIKLILDMKKSGDWSLVNWVRHWNIDNYDKKALFVSGDKLCALKSILNGNPTLFGNYIADPAPLRVARWRKYTRTYSEPSAPDMNKMFGFYEGNQQWTIDNAFQEIEYIASLFPEIFVVNEEASADEPSVTLKSFVEISDILSGNESFSNILVHLNTPISDFHTKFALMGSYQGGTRQSLRALTQRSLLNLLFSDTGGSEGVYRLMFNEFWAIIWRGGKKVIDDLKEVLKNLRLIPEILMDLISLLDISVNTIESSLNTIIVNILGSIQVAAFGKPSDYIEKMKIIRPLEANLTQIETAAVMDEEFTRVASGAASPTRRRTSRVNKTLSGNWVKTFNFAKPDGTLTEDVLECNFKMSDITEDSGSGTEQMERMVSAYDQLIHKDLLIRKLDYQFNQIPNIYKKIIDNVALLNGPKSKHEFPWFIIKECVNAILHEHFHKGEVTGDDTMWESYDSFMSRFVSDPQSSLKSLTTGLENCIYFTKCLKEIAENNGSTTVYDTFINRLAEINNVFDQIS